MSRALAILCALACAAALAACGDDPGGAASALKAAAESTAVETAAEGATGLTLDAVDVPDAARDAGVAALLTTGPDAQGGQRLLVAIGGGDRPNDISEDLKAELGALIGVDVGDRSPPLGWGSMTIKGQGDPVFVIHRADAPTRDELEELDRSDELKTALAAFGLTD